MQPLWRVVVACVLVSPGIARAGVNMEVAAGVKGNQESTLVLLGITRESGTIFGIPTYQELDIGGWAGEYRASLAGIAQGVRLRFGATLVEASTGGSYISQTSNRLSTEFEFYEQLSVRRKILGADFALSYRHWSNAGIRYPNLGMDFVGVAMSYHW